MTLHGKRSKSERIIFLCKVLASRDDAASEERYAMRSNETEQQIL